MYRIHSPFNTEIQNLPSFLTKTIRAVNTVSSGFILTWHLSIVIQVNILCSIHVTVTRLLRMRVLDHVDADPDFGLLSQRADSRSPPLLCALSAFLICLGDVSCALEYSECVRWCTAAQHRPESLNADT